MSFTSISRSVATLAVTGFLLAGFAGAEPTKDKQLEMQKEGIELIGQLEDVARDIHFNADRLNTLSHRSSKFTRQHHLMQIRELVNDGLQPALKRLTEIQPELKEWHRDVIDKMLVSAKGLAVATNSAMLNQNENGSLPTEMNPQYKQLVSSIAEHAENLVKTSDAAGAYAAAHSQAEEAGLKLPKH
jgi:hypothetical protein